MRINLKNDEWLLALIILIAAILRFWNYSNLPMTYDEFSALSRTHFDNFRDMIHFGVVTSDTHPAGVQVFMYYWVKWFGEDAMAVKLPFILAGILSIYFTFRIAEQWFNSTVALITSMFMAFLQYPITYTQMARPYASGILLSVLLVWLWSRAFIQCKNRCYGSMAGFVVIAALCAYNHYFTLFFASLVGISGFFIIERNKFKTYSISLIIAILLYLPHLKIFFIQLAKGGVEEWLSKPAPGFFLHYLVYILQYSVLMYSITGILFILSFVMTTKSLIRSNQYRVLIFVWIGITYGVAYFYSVYINAVLQFSVLFFTFPFLIMLLFSFFRNVRFIFRFLIVVVFGSVAIYTLINGRHHYEIFYHSGVKEILQKSEQKIEEKGADNITVMTDLPGYMSNYYCKKLNIDQDQIVDIDKLNGVIPFRNFIQSGLGDYLILGWCNQKELDYFNIAQDYFPYVLDEQNWFLCDYYLLSKVKPAGRPYEPAEKVVYHYEKKFNENDRPLHIRPSDTYYNIFGGLSREIIRQKYNNLFLKLTATSNDTLKDVLLITEFRLGDSLVDWRSRSLLEFADSIGIPFKVYEAVNLIDMDFGYPKSTFNIYFWNKSHADFLVSDFELTVRDGNPLLYSLYYDFNYPE